MIKYKYIIYEYFQKYFFTLRCRLRERITFLSPIPAIEPNLLNYNVRFQFYFDLCATFIVFLRQKKMICLHL